MDKFPDMLKWGLVMVCMLAMLSLHCQDAPPKRTSNTVVGKKGKAPGAKKKKKIRYLLKPNTQNTSYGNPCVVEITQSKGFEYMVTLKGQPGYESELQRAFHNFGVNVALLFRNGPFWKTGLQRKMKDCRRKSGDYVGP